MTTKFKGRREDFRLVTGQGRFSADWVLPGQAYGCFLRSDRAHAEVLEFDAGQASASPEVLAILTGADTRAEGFGSTPQLVRYPGRGGSKIKEPRREVLAESRVRFVGQPLALVIAETFEAAQAACDKIAVSYRDLPFVVDGAAALEPEAPQLYSEITGNLCFDYVYGDEAAAERAFQSAKHVAEIEIFAQRLVGNPMEPKAAVACYDSRSETYDLYAPTQGLTLMRHGLSEGMGVQPSKIRVHAEDVGGGFGVRSEAYAEYCALMLAARKVGRPVKWVGSRGETMLSDHHGRDARIEARLAMDEEGRFLAFRFEWVVNCGAYLSSPGPLINTLPAAGHSANLYRVPIVFGRHRLALTNTTPTTAYRGAGRPNVSYAVERLVDEAARVAGIDRIELRRRNLLQRRDFPYKAPPIGFEYDSGDPPALLETALRAADWDGFEGRRAQSRVEGKLRGIGLAAFVEPAGGGGSPAEEAAICFGASGDVTLFAMSGPSGQGHETAFPEIVSRVIGLPAERIVYRASDPDGPSLAGDGTVGSRSTLAQGSALHLAALEAVRKGRELAASELEADPADIEFSQGIYRVAGSDLSVSLAQLATRRNGAGGVLDSEAAAPQSRSFPSGVHVAEVEIDPLTGQVEVLNYVAVDDCGTLINPTLVEGQMHGGVAQGIGQALGEICVYDESTGQLGAGSFMDYEMPRADRIGPMQAIDLGVPSPNNPLGVKGAGEAGTTGAVPALANAVLDALAASHVRTLDMPYTPFRVWRALKEAE